MPESEIVSYEITELVRDNFDRIVHDPKKDVFVHFYNGKK